MTEWFSPLPLAELPRPVARAVAGARGTSSRSPPDLLTRPWRSSLARSRDIGLIAVTVAAALRLAELADEIPLAGAGARGADRGEPADVGQLMLAGQVVPVLVGVPCVRPGTSAVLLAINVAAPIVGLAVSPAGEETR